MTKLWIASFLPKEIGQAEEFRFLLDWLTVEARKEFEAVTLDQTQSPPPDDFDYVLVLKNHPAFLSALSIRQMMSALCNGCDGAAAVNLLENSDFENQPLNSLADFEQFESRLLDRETLGNKANEGIDSPVSLWHRTPIIRYWDALGRDDSAAQNQHPTDLSLISAGVYFPFADYFGHERRDILPYIPAGTQSVLEIGCGEGLTAELLQTQLGCLVTGIELHSGIAEKAARRIHRVINADIESLMENGTLDQSFDVVLGLDVIEHLRDPVAFFRWARARLSEGGRLVANIPNVGHYSVVKNLVAGRWDYTPAGIQCVTHLRFFTRNGLELMLRMAGFERWDITAKLSPLPTEIENWNHLNDVDMQSLATESFYLVAEK